MEGRAPACRQEVNQPVSSAYEQAVALTNALLETSSLPQFTFPLTSTTVTVAPDAELVPHDQVNLNDAGEGLWIMCCAVQLPGLDGTLRTAGMFMRGPTSRNRSADRRAPGFSVTTSTWCSPCTTGCRSTDSPPT